MLKNRKKWLLKIMCGLTVTTAAATPLILSECGSNKPEKELSEAEQYLKDHASPIPTTPGANTWTEVTNYDMRNYLNAGNINSQNLVNGLVAELVYDWQSPKWNDFKFTKLDLPKEKTVTGEKTFDMSWEAKDAATGEVAKKEFKGSVQVGANGTTKLDYTYTHTWTEEPQRHIRINNGEITSAGFGLHHWDYDGILLEYTAKYTLGGVQESANSWISLSKIDTVPIWQDMPRQPR